MKLGKPQKGSRSAQQIAYYGIAVVGALIVFGLGYFLLVKPQQAKASQLTGQISAKSAELIQRSSEVHTDKQLAKVQVADLLDLTRAMPDTTQMADVIITLNKLAYDSGVKFSAITPSPTVIAGTYTAVPLKITVEGSYYDLMEFLYDLRQLVSVRDLNGDGKLVASGRLFVVDKLSISLDQGGDPHKPPLRADVELSAFVYGTPAPPPSSTTSTGTTTGATTTNSTTTTAAASASSAGGG